MKNEDGFNSGIRGIGRFASSLIPWALAIGAMAWLGFWVAMHQYREAVDQENRRAVYVGAGQKPKNKIKIEARNIDCMAVSRVDLDGRSLTIYTKNTCHRDLSYVAVHWQVMSPDRTILGEGYDNGVQCPTPRLDGSVAECKLTIPVDDRMDSILVWATITP